MNPESGFAILEPEHRPEYCGLLRAPDEMQDRWKLAKGVETASGTWSDLEFRMADEFPGIQVPDMLYNALGLLMISATMKGVLESASTARIDYIPFVLRSHKDRVVAHAYIANVIGRIDCVDTTRTEAVEKSGRPGEYLIVNRLFLREEAVPDHVNIFRIGHRPRVVLVRRELRIALEDHGLTGIAFRALGEEISL